ncbi:uncharacterized protein LOC116128979 isoform X1 [Pistacia vera]|uniref:uncharacterized protein LOC116113807 isoform X1 n=2 Tax=Pistacia vera TaxID=55513 RepID=UPI001263108C|nr:uncharacterized protein LOC116113807 isoform X1 [Pistacia vera]XP_031273487.1 uncharacterized protein LOC116128979 isoform X1 [Pistacia vera]XP_031279514.1 uncharacterized protein LOC116128979 isoform X1 [Pistacia vera]XP_031285315.1 uncharacterized protein LOC116128979 isoform X1 [Pistacia vera]
MVRFSCFSSNIYCPKPKKTVQPSVEAMPSSFREFSQIQTMRDSPNSTHLKQLFLSAPGDTQINGDEKHVSSSSFVERGWKSEEIKSKFSLEIDMPFNELGHLKKSRSLGSRLCWEGRSPGENDTELETDQGFSSDSHDQNGLVVQNGSNNPVASIPSKYQKTAQSESVQVGSDHVNMESMFSIGDPQNSEKKAHENIDAPISGLEDCAADYVEHISRTPTIGKSQSSTNISGFMCSSGVCSSLKNLAPNSRSADDLQALDMRWKDMSVHDVDSLVRQKQERGDDICKTVENHFDTPGEDCFDSSSYSASAKDWIIPDEVNSVKNLHGESSTQKSDNLPSKDFKIKRIEEWVNDLQHCSLCSPLEETNDSSLSNDQIKKDRDVLNGLNFAKVDGKVTPGMEAAKRYIASLNGSATTAQLSNHGLVVIPFLSAFVSLKVLNLSGNAIVRITAGALPRGLHMLNLSKNNISTIEGLRELTRLRVLDLSYNRIFRIGHGLASCSSLKELYLAGNKISEVEGLHRLLKLTVLDLRFNKISTAKCLGQLAANYNSLQAVSLEGNPAQKNVGDEHLKKYLQSVLPNLVYLNRQPMKASTLKDTADRSVRLGISAHQFDRGLRSDNKATRKSSHGVGSHRPLSSSTHGRKNQTVVSPPKRPRSRHVRLPPTGTKATTSHRQNYIDLGNKLLNLKSELSIRRSRSEGTIGGGL